MCNSYRIQPKCGAAKGIAGRVADAVGKLPSSLVRKSDPGVVLRADGRVEIMRWGFHRGFNPSINNARSDKLEGGMWKDAFHTRRCVIPMTLFYEWGPGVGDRKQAHEFYDLEGDYLWVAGIWEEILASKANTTVIIRRGPSKSVCTILWDRRNDTFKLGQWLRGRIYERRCDLSPDGKHFIYFAMNGKWDGPVKGSWTAISRSPYLKALALWPWGDCWNGGGLFLSDNRFWLNNHWYDEATDTIGRLGKKLVQEPGHPFDESYGGECPGVYYLRLQRDGWKLLRDESPSAEVSVTVFEKPLQSGWVLEKSAHASIDSPVGSGCYYDTHRLLHPESGTIQEHPEWEWAELDRKRLVWVTKGVLYAAKIHGKGLGDVKALHDFNDMAFEAIAAPY